MLRHKSRSAFARWASLRRQSPDRPKTYPYRAPWPPFLLINKADNLLNCDDQRNVHKPLVGPLRGFFRITYGRYRAIYTVEEERIANGDVLVHLRVLFVAAATRKERSREDIYKVAKNLIDLGIVKDVDADASE